MEAKIKVCLIVNPSNGIELNIVMLKSYAVAVIRHEAIYLLVGLKKNVE